MSAQSKDETKSLLLISAASQNGYLVTLTDSAEAVL